MNSLERNKQSKNPLLSEINTLDSAVYGGTNSYGQKNNYGQSNYGHTSGYSSDNYSAPPTNYQYTPYSAYEQQTKQYESPQYAKTSQYSTPQKNYSQTTNATPKPFSSETNYDKSYNYSGSNQFGSTDKSRYDNVPSSGSYTKFDTSSHLFEPPKYDFNKATGDGYTNSEYSTSTYKIPGGTQTDTYKYETYHSASDPVYSSTSEKYYTSTPNTKVQFTPIDTTPFKNGSSSYSSNVEYITQAPVLKDSDTLEQKMLKKSVTQQVIEKKTVQTTRSTRQESSTKNFRFD